MSEECEQQIQKFSRRDFLLLAGGGVAGFLLGASVIGRDSDKPEEEVRVSSFEEFFNSLETKQIDSQEHRPKVEGILNLARKLILSDKAKETVYNGKLRTGKQRSLVLDSASFGAPQRLGISVHLPKDEKGKWGVGVFKIVMTDDITNAFFVIKVMDVNQNNFDSGGNYLTPRAIEVIKNGFLILDLELGSRPVPREALIRMIEVLETGKVNELITKKAVDELEKVYNNRREIPSFPRPEEYDA